MYKTFNHSKYPVVSTNNIVISSIEDEDFIFDDRLINTYSILKIKNAIWLLEIAIQNNNFPLKSNEPNNEDLFSYLPYCFEDVNYEGKKILLNRQYRPVGWVGNRAPYRMFPYHQISLPMDKLSYFNENYFSPLWTESSSPYMSRNNAIKYLMKITDIVNFLEANQIVNR